jgi:lambda family phage minor tail protein L
MPIAADLQSLTPGSRIEFYVLDLAGIGDTIYYFVPASNEFSAPVVWQGVSYTPWPIEAEGFDLTARGSLPRPKIRAANLGGLLSALCLQFGDCVGAKVTRKRTLTKYLDAENFVAGNPGADPTQYFPDDVYIVDQKTVETRDVVEWELASVFDLAGVMLPRRQIIQNTCLWTYKGADCGYIPNPALYGQDVPGGIFNELDQSVSDPAQDKCAKHFSSCKKRFGGADLPFGGFPAAGRVSA